MPVKDCTHYACTTHFAFYVSTIHFPSTRLDDSTHLQCYYRLTVICFIPHYVSTHLRFYDWLSFYTTLHSRFYTSTLLLHCICPLSIVFLPLYVFTLLRFFDSLSFFSTIQFYACTMLPYADCHFTVRTTHLRFYGSLCFYTTVRFYDTTVRQLSVLFYTTGSTTYSGTNLTLTTLSRL